MVHTKEYRICMPISVEEYHIGQVYMIARHSLEQSGDGSGVEVVENKICEDPEHGKGHFTEKRIHLSSRLPYWIQAMCPKVFYITEKAWNYYPYTITDYTCSFVPRFRIEIMTRYENNSGTTDNCLELRLEELAERIVEHIDIAYDEVSAKHYKEEEDPRYYKSKKTGRGPLMEGWRNNHNPIMCSYKVVKAYFEVWGMQTKVEEFVQSCIREILVLGHRQAFAWMDDWIEMDYAKVKEYEEEIQAQTNIMLQDNTHEDDDLEEDSLTEGSSPSLEGASNRNNAPALVESPKSPPERKGYFASFWS
uniref:Protein retinal degeneration B n=1 Tax=Speonomus longicornis TaxID=371512 RepID=L8BSU6_9COLE|nr:protein retinal degeneration B [Speonomus longicornis]